MDSWFEKLAGGCAPVPDVRHLILLPEPAFAQFSDEVTPLPFQGLSVFPGDHVRVRELSADRGTPTGRDVIARVARVEEASRGLMLFFDPVPMRLHRDLGGDHG